jgi:hypothetical protein
MPLGYLNLENCTYSCSVLVWQGETLASRVIKGGKNSMKAPPLAVSPKGPQNNYLSNKVR